MFTISDHRWVPQGYEGGAGALQHPQHTMCNGGRANGMVEGFVALAKL